MRLKKGRARYIGCLFAVVFISSSLLSCSGGKKENETNGEEVVSKRVKIDLKDLEKGEGGMGGAEGVGGVGVGMGGSGILAQSPPQDKTAGKAPPPSTEVLPQEGLKEYASKEPPTQQALKREPVLREETQKAAVKEPVKPAKAPALKKAAKPARPASLKEAFKNPWAINVASFSNSKDAEGLNTLLKKSGYNSYTMEFMKDGKKWYRVRIGFYKTKEEAVKTSRTISLTFGIPTAPWVVKPPLAEVMGRR